MKLLVQGYLLVRHHFECFTVADMNCLTAKEYLYSNLPLICSTYRNTSRSVPDSLIITGFVTRVTRRVSLVEQELLTLPSSTPIFCARSLTSCVVFCRSFFVLFSFSHCQFFFNFPVVNSDYPYGIFKLFFHLYAATCQQHLHMEYISLS